MPYSKKGAPTSKQMGAIKAKKKYKGKSTSKQLGIKKK